jgi:hypothetical protein
MDWRIVNPETINAKVKMVAIKTASVRLIDQPARRHTRLLEPPRRVALSSDSSQLVDDLLQFSANLVHGLPHLFPKDFNHC